MKIKTYEYKDTKQNDIFIQEGKAAGISGGTKRGALETDRGVGNQADA